MRSVLRRTRAETCLSDLRLDQLLAAELNELTAEAARSHVGECEKCRARLAAIEASRDAFREHAPALAQPKNSDARSAEHRDRGARILSLAAPAAAALAAAAAFMFWFREPVSRTDPDLRASPTESATRVKGNAHVGFFVRHGGVITLGASGDIVRPGDTLQFTYTTERAAYFALLSVDGARKASIYYPDGPRAVRIEPGRDVPLGASTVLDAVVGPETTYALFCAEPLELEPLRAAFAERPDAPSIPPSCEVDRVQFVKRAAP